MRYLLFLPVSLLTQALASPLTKRIPENFAFAAFGDSFSAGIGAGNFFTGSPDDRDNICARMTESYPAQLVDIFLRGKVSHFDFFSCSGDILDDIDGQVAKLVGNHVDVASLSISGNDFNFGNVVANCVYPTRTKVSSANAQSACDTELNKAQAAVADNSIFAKYRSKVQLIQSNLNSGGVIYITGYAKFFSPDGSSGDQCDTTTFFNSLPIRTLLGVLNMKVQNRDTMNNLVDQVNQRIQNDVVAQLGGANANIVFIDIDSHFDGHRFCEPGQDPWGSNDVRVFFNDLFTDLAETGTWQGPAHPDDLWAPNITGNPGQTDPGFRGITDLLQQNSVFHPKPLAHGITASQIFIDVAQRIGTSFTIGPNQICEGFGPGGGNTCFPVPAGCVGSNPVDNTTPVIACSNGTIISGLNSAGKSGSPASTSPPAVTGNAAGTNIHVNNGCIVINDSPRCAGGNPYNVAFQNAANSTATIYGKLPSDTTNKMVTPGCQLDALIPYNYGDVYFGADNCLYDSSSNRIYGQCCTQTTSTQVSNPYFK